MKYCQILSTPTFNPIWIFFGFLCLEITEKINQIETRQKHLGWFFFSEQKKIIKKRKEKGGQEFWFLLSPNLQRKNSGKISNSLQLFSRHFSTKYRCLFLSFIEYLPITTSLEQSVTKRKKKFPFSYLEWRFQCSNQVIVIMTKFRRGEEVDMKTSNFRV